MKNEAVSERHAQLSEIFEMRHEMTYHEMCAVLESLRAEVAALTAEKDACAFALRGNYPESLRDFETMPAEIERLHSAHNDTIDEVLALTAENARLGEALRAALRALGEVHD